MTHCTYCNTFVSHDFVRVFGDESGRVLACPNCAAKAGISETIAERKAGA
ncbi:MAG: DUF7563 family protein [Halobacteriota archaeon]